MRRIALGMALLTGLAAHEAGAAVLEVNIDLSDQRMTVSQHGFPRHVWSVSTARGGYVTPTGNFRPTRLERVWFSRKYDNSPMPNSVFFKGGYAIHGTQYVKSLGRPASHGCVRLHPDNARTLYNLVQSTGAKNTAIRITY